MCLFALFVCFLSLPFLICLFRFRLLVCLAFLWFVGLCLCWWCLGLFAMVVVFDFLCLVDLLRFNSVANFYIFVFVIGFVVCFVWLCCVSLVGLMFNVFYLFTLFG